MLSIAQITTFQFFKANLIQIAEWCWNHLMHMIDQSVKRKHVRASQLLHDCMTAYLQGTHLWIIRRQVGISGHLKNAGGLNS